MQDTVQLADYFRQLIEMKRRKPADDLLSALIKARDVFTSDEKLISNCMMVFAAGRITTKKLLGNGIPLLLSQWEHYQEASHLHSSLLKPLGEELLRLVTPTRYLVRQAIEDVDLSAVVPGNFHLSMSISLRIHQGLY
jgi:cytochrome P450